MAANAMSPADRRPAARATDAPTLDQRIKDMEERLAVERAQAAAHLREFGGNVRRRLTSPTSLIFSAGIGFMTAELVSARSRAVRAAQRSGKSKAQQEAAGKSVFASITKPILTLLRVGVLGFFAKKNKDLVETVEGAAPTGASDMTYTLH